MSRMTGASEDEKRLLRRGMGCARERYIRVSEKYRMMSVKVCREREKWCIILTWKGKKRTFPGGTARLRMNENALIDQ